MEAGDFLKKQIYLMSINYSHYCFIWDVSYYD